MTAVIDKHAPDIWAENLGPEDTGPEDTGAEHPACEQAIMKTAGHLVEKYGSDAVRRAEYRAEVACFDGDGEGCQIWHAIAEAAGQLLKSPA